MSYYLYHSHMGVIQEVTYQTIYTDPEKARQDYVRSYTQENNSYLTAINKNLLEINRIKAAPIKTLKKEQKECEQTGLYQELRT